MVRSKGRLCGWPNVPATYRKTQSTHAERKRLSRGEAGQLKEIGRVTQNKLHSGDLLAKVQQHDNPSSSLIRVPENMQQGERHSLTVKDV